MPHKDVQFQFSLVEARAETGAKLEQSAITSEFFLASHGAFLSLFVG
jgi:hypothetical protein